MLLKSSGVPVSDISLSFNTKRKFHFLAIGSGAEDSKNPEGLGTHSWIFPLLLVN